MPQPKSEIIPTACPGCPFGEIRRNMVHHTLRAQKKITVKDFTFHFLRHTFVTRANEVGDLATVRDLVGHSDYRTTQIYTHPRAVEKRKDITKLGTRFFKLDFND